MPTRGKHDVTAPLHPKVNDDSPTKAKQQVGLRLRGVAAKEFLAFLKVNVALLRRMVTDELQLQVRISFGLYRILEQIYRQREVKEFDLTKRRLTWTLHDKVAELHCDTPALQGLVGPSRDGLSWEGWIEKPNMSRRKDMGFSELHEAVEWVDLQLEQAQS